MRRDLKERTYRTTEYDDPEIYFERVRQRKKRQAEEEFRNRKKTARPEKQVKARSYREEKEYYERSKRLHQYGKQHRTQYADREAVRDDRYKQVKISSQKPKKKKGKFAKVLIGIGVFLLLLIIAAGVIWFNPALKQKTIRGILKSPFGPSVVRMLIGTNYENNVRDKNFNENDIRINEGMITPKGNITFALLGVDARDEDLTIGTMADSMIVVNVDSNGEIKMGSIYRDTYLLSRNSDGSEVISKANSAYFRNGPAGTINLMNENFDLAIKDYIVVNFAGLSNIIDTVGGITLKVTEEEKEALNYHMYEQNMYAGTEYVPLESYGDAVHLTGNQATAFCRLRKVTFNSPLDGVTYTDDYGRTARQRYVLTELVKQTKEKGILKLLGLMDEMFKANSGDRKFIQTSLTIKELTKIIAQGFDMNLGANAAFPDFNHQYTMILDSGDSMVADTLEENAKLFHEFLYPGVAYENSQNLIEIAHKISAEIQRQIN